MYILNGEDLKNESIDTKFQDELLYDLKVWFKQHRIWYNRKYIKLHHSITNHCQSTSTKLCSDSDEEDGAFERRCSNLKYEIPTSGHDFGILAIKNVPEDALVCKIPKESILSWKTGGLSNILEDDCIGGGIALVLTLMYELKLKEKSPWYGYLKSLQNFESLPVFWSESEFEYLKGTEAYEETCKSKTDIEDDYQELVVPLFTRYPEAFDTKFFSLENFFKASSLVSSRAFEVDSYHGDAMVPLADLFNHKSGAEHVHVESTLDVCDMCGAADACPHDVDEFESEQEEHISEENPGCSPISSTAVIVGTDSIEELISIEANSDASSHPEDKLDSDDSIILSEEDYFDCISDFDRKNTIDMRMFRPALTGSELFNTYGERSSSYLLVKYGFAELDNLNESIKFTLEAVLDTCTFIAGLTAEDIDRRYQFFTNCNDILEAAHETEAEPNSEDEAYSDEALAEDTNGPSKDVQIEECHESQEEDQEGEEEEEEFEDEGSNEEQSDDQEGSINSQDSENQDDKIKKPVFRILYGGRVETSFLVLIHTMFMSTDVIKMLAGSEEFESLVSFYFARVIAQWETITTPESDNEVPEEMLQDEVLTTEPKKSRDVQLLELSPDLANHKRFKNGTQNGDEAAEIIIPNGGLKEDDEPGTSNEEDLGPYKDLLPNPEIAHMLAEVLQTLIESRLAQFPGLEPPYLSAIKPDPVLIQSDFKLLNEALPPYNNPRIQFAMMCRIAEKSILSKCLDSLPI